jgi:N-methylhydantoinase A
VAPQIREYPRASTAAVNAYAMPISLPYLRGLSERLKRESFPNSPLIMLSSGGVVGAETAGRNPARMIESGPPAGALAGCHYAEVLGIQRLMSFDMGGTTAKACLIDGRRAAHHRACLKWTGDGDSRRAAVCPSPSRRST